MTDNKIAEIRARHEAGPHSKLPPMGDPARAEAINAGWRTFCAEADADRATLLAEDARHRAEIERLHKAHEAACRGGEWLLAEKVSLRARMCGEISDLRAENERLIRERDEARAEVDKLRAENARLRAQIAEYFAEPATHPVEES